MDGSRDSKSSNDALSVEGMARKATSGEFEVGEKRIESTFIFEKGGVQSQTELRKIAFSLQ